jgi:hypothetical protein
MLQMTPPLPPQSLQRRMAPQFVLNTLRTETGLTNADDFYAVNVAFQHTILYCIEY